MSLLCQRVVIQILIFFTITFGFCQVHHIHAFNSSIKSHTTAHIPSLLHCSIEFGFSSRGGGQGRGSSLLPVPLDSRGRRIRESTSLNLSSKHVPPRDRSSFENKESFQVNGSQKHGGSSNSSSNSSSIIHDPKPLLVSQITELKGGEEDYDKLKILDNNDKNDHHLQVEEKHHTSININEISDDEKKEKQSIQKYWKYLYQMMRPGNFPGVFMFHLIGIHRSLSTLSVHLGKNLPYHNTYTFQLFLQTAFQPTIFATLVALLLIVSSSMLVNDYYDTRSGVDGSPKESSTSSSLSDTTTTNNKPLSSGEVPLPIAKKLLSIMYGTLLTIVAILPGTPTRLLVVMGTMLTFYYTKYLKPRTWWKNIVCAILMSLAPVTSGLATLSHPFVTDAVVKMSSSSLFTTANLWTSSWKALGPLTCSLFCGFMGREMIMDITDCSEDRDAGIRTIPVRFGIETATKIVLLFWLCAGLFISTPPLMDLWSSLSQQLVRGGGGGGMKMGAAGLYTIISTNAVSLRRSSFALVGGGWLAIRAIQLVSTKGKDESVMTNAIEEAKLNVLFILAASI